MEDWSTVFGNSVLGSILGGDSLNGNINGYLGYNTPSISKMSNLPYAYTSATANLTGNTIAKWVNGKYIVRYSVKQYGKTIHGVNLEKTGCGVASFATALTTIMTTRNGGTPVYVTPYDVINSLYDYSNGRIKTYFSGGMTGNNTEIAKAISEIYGVNVFYSTGNISNSEISNFSSTSDNASIVMSYKNKSHICNVTAAPDGKYYGTGTRTAEKEYTTTGINSAPSAKRYFSVSDTSEYYIKDGMICKNGSTTINDIGSYQGIAINGKVYTNVTRVEVGTDSNGNKVYQYKVEGATDSCQDTNTSGFNLSSSSSGTTTTSSNNSNAATANTEAKTTYTKTTAKSASVSLKDSNSHLNIRDVNTGEVVGKLNQDSKVTVVGTDGKYSIIEQDGKEYKVASEYLKEESSSVDSAISNTNGPSKVTSLGNMGDFKQMEYSNTDSNNNATTKTNHYDINSGNPLTKETTKTQVNVETTDPYNMQASIDEPVKTTTATVKINDDNSHLNVRDANTGKVVSKLNQGDTVNVLRTEGDYSIIEQDGKEYKVASSYLRGDTQEATVKLSDADSHLNVRDISTNKVVNKLANDTTVSVKYKGDDYSIIEQDGKEYKVATEYLNFNNNNNVKVTSLGNMGDFKQMEYSGENNAKSDYYNMKSSTIANNGKTNNDAITLNNETLVLDKELSNGVKVYTTKNNQTENIIDETKKYNILGTPTTKLGENNNSSIIKSAEPTVKAGSYNINTSTNDPWGQEAVIDTPLKSNGEISQDDSVLPDITIESDNSVSIKFPTENSK